MNGTAAKICAKGFTTRTVRPPVAVTNRIKRDRMLAYGVDPAMAKAYELDHLISLTVGGDPTATDNLWPEPWERDNSHPDGVAATGTGAQTKDKVENWLRSQLCSGQLPLERAQQGEATNWAQYIPAATGGTGTDSSSDG